MLCLQYSDLKGQTIMVTVHIFMYILKIQDGYHFRYCHLSDMYVSTLIILKFIMAVKKMIEIIGNKLFVCVHCCLDSIFLIQDTI